MIDLQLRPETKFIYNYKGRIWFYRQEDQGIAFYKLLGEDKIEMSKSSFQNRILIYTILN